MINNFKKFCQYTSKYIFYRRDLAAFLDISISAIDKFYQELYHDAFLEQMKLKTNAKGNFFDFGMLNFMRAPVLYVVCRMLRPKIVLETGVANGFSSSFILKALEQNGEGWLYSIDFPNRPGEEIANEVGWIIPYELKKRWELIIGDSKEKLPKTMNNLKEIDIFYHDSDHSYDHVLFELTTVWEGIKRNGIIVVDDTNMNNAFVDFCRSKGQEYKKFYWLGIARKTGITGSDLHFRI